MLHNNDLIWNLLWNYEIMLGFLLLLSWFLFLVVVMGIELRTTHTLNMSLPLKINHPTHLRDYPECPILFWVPSTTRSSPLK